MTPFPNISWGSLEILPSLLNQLDWEVLFALVLMKMGFDNPLLISKLQGCLSIFSSFPENVLICLLLVGLASAPEKTDFVQEDAHVSNPAFCDQKDSFSDGIVVFLIHLRCCSNEMPSTATPPLTVNAGRWLPWKGRLSYDVPLELNATKN